eukprot:SAG31_NODE_14940_length_779_cov_1.064706_1_plen_74_part_10
MLKIAALSAQSTGLRRTKAKGRRGADLRAQRRLLGTVQDQALQLTGQRGGRALHGAASKPNYLLRASRKYRCGK